MVDYRIFDRDKFTIVGTPTITDDGIASGFSGSNRIYKILTVKPVNSLEFYGRLIYKNNGISYIIDTFTTNNVRVGISKDTGGYIMLLGFGTQIGFNCGTLTDGDIVDYHVVITPNSHYIEGSVNNGAVVRGETKTDGGAIPTNLAIDIGNLHNGSNQWACGGKIDLKQFSITVDGVRVFSGSHNGTLTDKLIYLNDTKQIIKNAIIAKGVDITDDIPFRQYADKIIDIPAGSGDTYNVHFREYRYDTRYFSDGMYIENGNNNNNGILTNYRFPELYTANSWTIFTRFKYKSQGREYETVITTQSDSDHSGDNQGFLVMTHYKKWMPFLSTRSRNWDVFSGDRNTTLVNGNIYQLTISYNSNTGYRMSLKNENTGGSETITSAITGHISEYNGKDVHIAYNFLSTQGFYGSNNYYLKDSYIEIDGIRTYLCE